MNTDFVVGVSDKTTNNLNMIFNTKVGQNYLTDKKGFDIDFVRLLPEFGFSSIANIVASIKLAKYMNLGKDDAIISVATDGADLYLSELNKSKEDFEGIFDETSCAEIFGQYMKAISLDNMIELNQREKERIFNLGYYTWVEQQGVDIKDFEKRKKQDFWNDQYKFMLSLDKKIDQFNSIN